MGLLSNAIRAVVVSALGAKLARGRSPIVAALMMLLVSKAFAKRNHKDQDQTREPAEPAAQNEGGLDSLIERFRRGGFEDVIRSWISTGPNKAISPNQLQSALGPEKVENLERESGMPRDHLLSQLSRLLPEVLDRLTPEGKLPREEDLAPEPERMARHQRARVRESTSR